MRPIDQNTITDAVIEQMSGAADSLEADHGVAGSAFA